MKRAPACATTKASARRCAASRIAASCSGAGASSPTSSFQARSPACWCARRTPMRAFAGSTPRPPRPCPAWWAVFTGADMATDGMAPMRPLWAVRSRDGSAMVEPPRFALARATVRHGGEPVVAVIAETLAQATDAAERVEVDYEPLPAVTDARAAQAPGAPQLHQSAPGNVCFRWARGDEAAVRAAFASAPHVVAIDLVNNRLVGAAIEPRAAIATAEPDGSRLTLYTSTQAPHHIRRQVTEQLGIPESALRVISPDVGGGFGYKGKLYPEEGIVDLGRPPAGPSGAVGGDPGRELRVGQPGPRSPDSRRACVRCRRPFPGAARRHLGQSRCLCLDLRRRHSERDLQRLVRGRLSHARDLRRSDGCLHQHHADRRVSRRRPAGGLLRAGAARRHGGARNSASIARRSGGAT